ASRLQQPAHRRVQHLLPRPLRPARAQRPRGHGQRVARDARRPPGQQRPLGLVGGLGKAAGRAEDGLVVDPHAVPGPGRFHAVPLRGRNPRVRDEIFVYGEGGRELDDFLAWIEAFNRRPEEPTSWRPVVWTGARAIERLIAERPGQVVILAGKNDRKLPAMRRLHDAGFHVLADKPWLTGPAGLDDLRHLLAGGPLAVEMMTGRHEITSILVGKLG